MDGVTLLKITLGVPLTQLIYIYIYIYIYNFGKDGQPSFDEYHSTMPTWTIIYKKESVSLTCQ